MWHRIANDKRKCNTCKKAVKDTNDENEMQCTGQCGKLLPRTSFSDSEWYGRHSSHVCRLCSTSPKAPQNVNQWTCKAPGCTFRGDKELFKQWRQKQKNPDKANGYQKCNVCFATWNADAQQRALRAADIANHVVTATKL